MARRPADYTARIKADEERKRQLLEKERDKEKQRQRLRARQAASYGAVVLDIVDTRFDIDQLAGIISSARDQADADPKLEEKWRHRGQAFFRRARDSNGASDHGPAADDAPRPEEPKSDGPGPHGSGAAGSRANGAPKRTPPLAPPNSSQRPDRETPPGASDLLGGTAPDRPGALPAKEE